MAMLAPRVFLSQKRTPLFIGQNGNLMQVRILPASKITGEVERGINDTEYIPCVRSILKGKEMNERFIQKKLYSIVGGLLWKSFVKNVLLPVIANCGARWKIVQYSKEGRVMKEEVTNVSKMRVLIMTLNGVH